MVLMSCSEQWKVNRMLRDGFLRFCDDPEIACCKAERELGELRTENAQIKKENKALDMKLSRAIKVIDGICEHCSWETGSKECVESECPIMEWRKEKDQESEVG